MACARDAPNIFKPSLLSNPAFCALFNKSLSALIYKTFDSSKNFLFIGLRYGDFDNLCVDWLKYQGVQMPKWQNLKICETNFKLENLSIYGTSFGFYFSEFLAL
ncbi:hypothetical protein BKN38_03825 [Helicobacter sp. CLO-3]|nr:hypothetical protein BA723_05720 [Helicobacter sp. CLO-3]OHU84162.1 hypothetical protein BKN38_03825 [Helicobacter sp. CLO-3]